MRNTKEQAARLIIKRARSIEDASGMSIEFYKAVREFEVGPFKQEGSIRDWECDSCPKLGMIENVASGSVYCCDHFEAKFLEGGHE